jgi:hypothetical protein
MLIVRRSLLLLLACLTPHAAVAQTVPDRLRDCALSVRDAAPPAPVPAGQADIPLARVEAQSSVSAFQAEMSRDEFEECLLLATVGFEHGFVPVTYVLEADNWAELSVRGATITHRGETTHFKWGFTRPGIRFLAPRHTQIASGSSGTRRHFIELFAWVRNDFGRGEWALRWHPFEVAGPEMIPIGVDPLLTVTADAPPSITDAEVHSMAAIRLTDAGRVEWHVGSGADARRGYIPSLADRRAHEEEARRQKAAYDKVDWNRVADLRRAPTLMYGGANGCGCCGHIIVYGWSEDMMDLIHLSADSELLRLSPMPQTFDVARNPTALALTVHVYARPVSSPFCSDVVVMPRPPVEKWEAVAGNVTMELVPTETVSGEPRQRATIRIVGAVFVNARGVRVAQIQPIVLTAVVGWVPG